MPEFSPWREAHTNYRKPNRERTSTRPRSKRRPDHSSEPEGSVWVVDRGRLGVRMDDGTKVVAVKARELGRRGVVVGDRVHVSGDISGRKDTLARITMIEPRTSQLRRSTTEGDGRERMIVANATHVGIVCACAQPEPKPGMIDRALIAAYAGPAEPFLILTKTDLASPEPIIEQFSDLQVPIFPLNSLDSAHTSDLENLRDFLHGKRSVLIGHSGVGKSTLLNALVPHAQRATGQVNDVTGKGRHTSTNAVAFELDSHSIVIDTPGVRSFGLAHVRREDLFTAFPDVHERALECPRGCTHMPEAPFCQLNGVEGSPALVRRIESFRRLSLQLSHE